MEQRHRKESKELQGRITQLKKSIGKGAATKQKKKEIQDQIAQMELDLTKRHEEEKQNFTLENGISSIELEDPVTLDSVTPDSVTLPETLNETGKKNKAKKRKERKMEELEEERKRAGEEALHLTNHKEIEQRAIDEILLSLNLKINEIPADGHCLYNSISHQLLVLSGKEYSYRDLRRLAAQYIKSNANDFLPFLIDDSGNMLDECILD
jgi:OTU domain-containing protein 6